MSDIIPGSSYWNPIWHGKWRIYRDHISPWPFAFVHDDYDGAPDGGDNRHGWGKSVKDCIEQIKEMEDEE